MPGELYSVKKVGGVWTKSRLLLLTGSCLCGLSVLLALLTIVVPNWIYINETMETTVAGLTDATEVTYHYGLIGFCLKMAATHLDTDECGGRSIDSLLWWERITLILYVVSMPLLAISVTMVILNLQCWNKLRFLITGTLSTVTAGVCQSVGVSMYQIHASTQVIDIDGLVSATFKSGHFSASFWFGFLSALVSLVATILLILGTSVWQRPKKPRKMIPRYKTTVHATKCPYRGRQPGIVSISQM